MPSRLREWREAAGLTQADLAARAGVSRQLVGAIEAGRHLPRVDAGLALAAALGGDVATLFGPHPAAVDVVSGAVPPDGTLVRVGRVGERTVTAPARLGPEGWDVADGVAGGGTVTPFDTLAPGFVVAGCEPGLQVLERQLREAGMAAVAATASSRAAAAALADGRVHAAVIHGPADRLPAPEIAVDRFLLSRWRVGLAASPQRPGRWWEEVLAGAGPVVQREEGAGVQRAFEEALGGTGPVPGPRVGSHVEAALRAMLTGLAAVTIEPAALAVGAAFHPLEVHEAELWVDRRRLGERAVAAALEAIAGARFQRRLAAVGGYDLAGTGSRR